ncbi:MAG: hypothetical protein KBS82_05460 [Oscillospiraceae bacterium]|nr:hypothetical protein [Candidatus Limimonas egerieequi]
MENKKELYSISAFKEAVQLKEEGFDVDEAQFALEDEGFNSFTIAAALSCVYD